MKRTIRITMAVALAMLLGALMIVPIQAQNLQNPNTVPTYNYYPLMTSKAYVISQVDTLPQPDAATGVGAGIRVGGASVISLSYNAKDSCSVICTGQYRILGQTTWTAIAAATGDTLVSTANGGVYYEFVFRSQTVSRLGGFDREIRFLLTHAGSAAGVSSATESAKLIWKQ